jgi:hypothetical protein
MGQGRRTPGLGVGTRDKHSFLQLLICATVFFPSAKETTLARDVSLILAAAVCYGAKVKENLCPTEGMTSFFCSLRFS